METNANEMHQWARKREEPNAPRCPAQEYLFWFAVRRWTRSLVLILHFKHLSTDGERRQTPCNYDALKHTRPICRRPGLHLLGTRSK